MFRYSRIITLFVAAFAAVSFLPSCQTTTVVPSPPAPVEPLKGYRITLFDSEGKVTAKHDTAADGIISEDPSNQEIRFRNATGGIIKYRGSYQKARLQ